MTCLYGSQGTHAAELSPVEGTESYLELGSLEHVSLRGSSLGGRSANPLLQVFWHAPAPPMSDCLDLSSKIPVAPLCGAQLCGGKGVLPGVWTFIMYFFQRL